MSVKISDHICERYAERVLDIPARNVIEYVAGNRLQIQQDIQGIYENSTLVYRGQIGQGKPPASFYVNGDIVIIMSFEDKRAITLFRPDFGYPPAVNRKIVRALVQEIQKGKRRLKEITPGIEKRVRYKKERIKAIDSQLDRYRKQIEKLEAEKKQAKRQIWAQNSRVEDLNKDITALASRLVLDGKEFCKKAKAK